MTTQNPGAAARLHLLHANRDAIAVMLARAAAGGLGLEGAVVIIIDQRDPLGAQLAAAAAEKAGLAADVEAGRVQSRGQIATAIVVVPVNGARILFREGHPEVASGLARHPLTGRVRVVVVAEGAAMLTHAEVSPAHGIVACGSS